MSPRITHLALGRGQAQGPHARDAERRAVGAELPGLARQPLVADGHRAGARENPVLRGPDAEQNDAFAGEGVRIAWLQTASRPSAGLR